MKVGCRLQVVIYCKGGRGGVTNIFKDGGLSKNIFGHRYICREGEVKLFYTKKKFSWKQFLFFFIIKSELLFIKYVVNAWCSFVNKTMSKFIPSEFNETWKEWFFLWRGRVKGIKLICLCVTANEWENLEIFNILLYSC